MNQTIQTIQNHVSVRAFTKQPLSEEQVRLLVTAAQAASSASFQQAYSIIGVTDPDLLKKISEEACNNDFIMDGGHFFVFCADVNRHKQLADDAQVDISKAINGIDAIIVGVRIFSLQLTKEPLLSAVGFVLAGLGGLGAAPFFLWFKGNKTVRMLGVLLLVATALLWAVTFYGSLWGHLDSFSKWVPATMGK